MCDWLEDVLPVQHTVTDAVQVGGGGEAAVRMRRANGELWKRRYRQMVHAQSQAHTAVNLSFFCRVTRRPTATSATLDRG